MNLYAKSANTYLTQRILGATPEQQAALIMEAGQLHLGKAIHALTQDNLPSAIKSFIRVSEVIMEATLRLNHESGGELAQNLQHLYGWWTKELMAASKARDTARLAAVARSMGEIRQAWEKLHETKAASNGETGLQLGDQVV